MNKLFLFLLLAICTLSITSCATFLNDNYTHITVYSNVKNAAIVLNDTVYASPASIKVKRDSNPLKFTLKNDSLNLSKEFYVKNKMSGIFISGNVPMVLGAPFGLLTDLTNKKRFTYPEVIQLNYFDENLSEKELKEAKKNYHRENWDFMEDHAQQLRKEERVKAFQRNILREKGDLVANYILPGYTHFLMNPEGPKIHTAGLMKVGYGLDYFYKDHKFLNADVIFKTNFIDPVISLMGLDLFILNPELSVTNNHRFNRFEVGYGLSLQYFFYNSFDNCWNCDNEPSFVGEMLPNKKPDIKESYFSISPKIKTAYQLNRRLYVGLFYQPSVIKFSNTNNNTKVDHIFGIDFRFKAKTAKIKTQ